MNDSELAGYLLKLAERLLDKAAEPVDRDLPYKEFIEQTNMRRGMVEAVAIVREEARAARIRFFGNDAAEILRDALHGASCPNELIKQLEEL